MMQKDHSLKIYKMSFASVYPHYIHKIEKKGRNLSELHEVISWLTGYDLAGIQECIADNRNFEDFFNQAPAFQPLAHQIKGSICGYKVQDIQDPIIQKTRYLDKLVDDLAKGKSLDKILFRS